MKLKQLLNHIPDYQNIRICELMQPIYAGYPTPLRQRDDLIVKTVGLVCVKDNALEINVYEPSR